MQIEIKSKILGLGSRKNNKPHLRLLVATDAETGQHISVTTRIDSNPVDAMRDLARKLGAHGEFIAYHDASGKLTVLVSSCICQTWKL